MLIPESSRISIGIQKHRIYWPVARLIHSHIYGIYEIQRNQQCHSVLFACVSLVWILLLLLEICFDEFRHTFDGFLLFNTHFSCFHSIWTHERFLYDFICDIINSFNCWNISAGATQVGFNRVSGNLLATAHDGMLFYFNEVHLIVYFFLDIN